YIAIPAEKLAEKQSADKGRKRQQGIGNVYSREEDCTRQHCSAGTAQQRLETQKKIGLQYELLKYGPERISEIMGGSSLGSKCGMQGASVQGSVSRRSCQRDRAEKQSTGFLETS